MKKIFSFQFEAGGQPVSEYRETLGRILTSTTPWFYDLALPLGLKNPAGRFQATLWGCDKPWKTTEGLEEIRLPSHDGVLQDPQLESLFPIAMWKVALCRRLRELAKQLPYPAKQKLIVIFPAFGAKWHQHNSVRVLESNYARLNDIGYRSAKSFAFVIPRGRRNPITLGAGPLFPIDGQGRDIPNERNTVFLQIHL